MNPLDYHTLPHSIAFKGGGGSGPIKKTAPAAAPPSTTTVEVTQAARDQRKQASKRRGMKSTILAGETGGFKQNGTSTILGNQGG